ncbi:MAG: asparagine synthase-related protein [Aliarcobacter sp.]|nr:asparagine synthase-related protein [Aliarcobacter sp.]
MARVPFALKYKNGDSKYLLKEILKKYLPNELINKQKKGFSIPLYKWFSNDLNFLFEKFLDENDIKEIRF